MITTAKAKKYYEIGEKVYLKELKRVGTIKELKIIPKTDVNEGTYKASVTYYNDDKFVTKEFNLWDLDKLKKRQDNRPFALDYVYKQVEEFHKAFNQPVACVPTLMDSERANARMSWIEEEKNEFLDAKTVVDQADAMIDLIYFALGTLVEIGVKPQPIMEIVQKANMSKLHDGVPKYREDGKILKPANWQNPEPLIEEEIKRQSN